MATITPNGRRGKEDEGGGRGEGDETMTLMADGHLTNDQYQMASALLNQRSTSEDQHTVDIFVKHLDHQERQDEQLRERRSSLPTSDAIELTTLSGVVRRRKQQFQQLRYQQQQSIDTSQQDQYNEQQELHHHHHHHHHDHHHQHHLMPVVAPKTSRPLSISSISSAASSGSSSSANSSSSSGVQSSLTRNGSLNYGHSFRRNAYLASIESLNYPSQAATGGACSPPASGNHSAVGGGGGGGTPSSIEEIFKNLNLSGVQLRDAATRAAVLAAGESQRRGFATPANRVSRINRSLHASLRYDKNTAYRIHMMANARALFNSNNNNQQLLSCTNENCDQNHEHVSGGGGDNNKPRTSNPLSRNDSSTSSDSGHPRQSPRIRAATNGRPFVCSCRQSMMTSSSSASQVDRAAANEIEKETNTTSETQAIRELFNKKAATLDSVTSQRSSDQPVQHHPGCAFNASGSSSNNFMRPRRASAKLQPSPSSASSHSNTSSLFRDDGFEDDLTSTTSEQAPTTSSSSSSSAYQRPIVHHRLSFQARRGHHQHYHQFHHNNQESLLCQHGEEDDDYQSCEEEFSNSHTTASTTSNLDDCALSTTSSSMICHQEPQVLDEVSLANVKKQYRKSLLLEHQQQQHLLHSQHAASQHQNKIQALLQPPPKLCHLPTTLSSPSSSANTSTTSTNVSRSISSPTHNVNKTTKCEDRTVNIIGHMPTRSPGYWDSNLSITQRVVTEIIETERTYVDDLEQIVTGYICYLRNVLKQHKYKQQRQQITTTTSHQVQNSNLMVKNKINNKDDCDIKSMSVFEDENTCQVGNDIDDCDVEEANENDISMRDDDNDISSNVKHNNDNKPIVAPPIIGSDGQTTTTTTTTSTTTLVSAIDIKKLFSNLEDIYKFNKDLLFRLEECYLNPSSVAECFVENALGFDVYTQYCTSYPQVVSTLTQLMANPATAQLLKERQEELNQSLPLGSYLLKPVQRILKYHILFQSLIKHTTDDEMVNEKDQQLINEAFSVMTSIACHINAMKKRHEHSIRVQEVQGLLCGWQGPDLTTLGELILEDTFKLYNRQRSARHLFLFDNVLLMTKKKRDGSLCYKGHIECSNLMLIENIEGQPLVFNTVPFDNPKALCSFQAKNLDKKRDWCMQMKEVIIKSFEVKIPVHVRDILMSLTNSGNVTETNTKSSSSESSRAIRAPNYLEKKKRTRLEKKK